MRAYTRVRAREEEKACIPYASPGGDVEKARITTDARRSRDVFPDMISSRQSQRERKIRKRLIK